MLGGRCRRRRERAGGEGRRRGRKGRGDLAINPALFHRRFGLTPLRLRLEELGLVAVLLHYRVQQLLRLPAHARRRPGSVEIAPPVRRWHPICNARQRKRRAEEEYLKNLLQTGKRSSWWGSISCSYSNTGSARQPPSKNAALASAVLVGASRRWSECCCTFHEASHSASKMTVQRPCRFVSISRAIEPDINIVRGGRKRGI